MIENYPFMYAKDISKELGMTLSAVYNYATSLNLKKDPSFRAMELQRQADRLKKNGVRHRFTKGQAPPNKGQKMSKEVYEKVKPTMFKKGQRPVNWKPDRDRDWETGV